MPSITSRSKDFMFAEQKRSGVLLYSRAQYLDDRYLRAVGYSAKSKR